MPPNIQNPAFSKWKSSPYGEDTGNTSSNMEEMGHQQHFGQCGSVPKAPISINNHNFGQMPNRRSSPSPSVSSPATVGSSTPGVSKLVEKNCMLVKLLAQTPHTTPTLPTSIATSNYDKMAKENKENPNKPRVATGLVESLLNRNRTAPNPVVPPPIGVNHVSSSTVPSPFMPAAAGSDQMLSQMSFARHRPPAYNELDLYSNSHLQQPPPNQPTQMPTGFPGSIGSQNGNWSVPGGLPMQQMMNSAYGNTNGPNGGDFFPPQPQDFGGNSFNRGDMPFMQNPTYSGTHGEMLNPNLPMSMAQRHVGMPPPTLNDSTGPYANSQGMAPNRNSLVSSMLESRSQPIPQYSGNSKGARRETAVRAALETPPNRQPLPQHQQHQAHMKRGRSVTDLMFENPDQQVNNVVTSAAVTQFPPNDFYLCDLA